MSLEADPLIASAETSLEDRPEISYREPRMSFAGRVTGGFLLILLLVAGIASMAATSPLDPC